MESDQHAACRDIMTECFAGWTWKPKTGYRMINKVSSTIQVGRRLYCMTNCTASPICDSCNYRPSDKTCQFKIHDINTTITLDSCVYAGSGLVLLTDKTCQFNTHDINTLITLDSCVHTGSGLVLLTRRASSRHMTHDINTPITLDSCVYAGSGLVLLTRCASSTLTTSTHQSL